MYDVDTVSLIVQFYCTSGIQKIEKDLAYLFSVFFFDSLPVEIQLSFVVFPEASEIILAV